MKKVAQTGWGLAAMSVSDGSEASCSDDLFITGKDAREAAQAVAETFTRNAKANHDLVEFTACEKIRIGGKLYRVVR